MLFALTHAASQLLYRWLPPPVAGAVDCRLAADACGDAVDPMLAEDHVWRDLLRWCALEGAGVLPWLREYARAHRDPDGSALARVAADHFARLRGAGGCYLSLADAAYPPALRAIPDPPLGLSLLGDPATLARPMIGIIGSRKASWLALRESQTLGAALARRGVAVVSGGAFGCDIAAHLGVLSAASPHPLPAVVVFAGGLGALYPRAHAGIFDRLRARGGVLLSERFFDASCRPLDFPSRNRIIAGLTPHTVVMQAARKSGASITARLALDQGRDVSVLLHPAGDVRASGSVALLSEGAHGFASAAGLVDALGLSEPGLTDIDDENQHIAPNGRLPAAPLATPPA